MIRLKNLVIDEYGNIVADIYPEDAENPGKISISKNKMLDFSLPEQYEWCKRHIRHAEKYIVDNFDEVVKKIMNDEIKTELLIMWC